MTLQEKMEEIERHLQNMERPLDDYYENPFLTSTTISLSIKSIRTILTELLSHKEDDGVKEFALEERR